MNKIEEFLMNSHQNGGLIDEQLLKDAVEEAMSAELLEEVEYNVTTYDENNRVKLDTPTKDETKIRVNKKVKQKINAMLKTASDFIETNGRAIEIINRVIGENVKDFTDPMMMLIDKNGGENSLADCFTAIYKAQKGEGKDACRFFSNSKTINPNVIAYLNKHKDWWRPLMTKVSGTNSLMKSNAVTGAGEFAIACMCPDLTMDFDIGTKETPTDTIPDLVMTEYHPRKMEKDIKPMYIEVKNPGKVYKGYDNALHGKGARISLKVNSDDPVKSISRYWDKGGILILTSTATDKSDAEVFCICGSGTTVEELNTKSISINKSKGAREVQLDGAYEVSPSIPGEKRHKLLLFKRADESCWRIVPYID